MTDKKTKGWKNAALGAMVFLTGLSSSLNAAAQKTTERDPQKDKTEILHSPQSAEDAYWEKYYNGEGTFAKVYSAGEEPGPAVRFSSKELARALVGTDLSEEQQKVFVKAYANSINDDMEITPEALRIVMERARFSKDQALKFKNALFAERENPEKTEDQYKDLEYHRATADNANVRYAFAPNGRVLIDGSISLDTNRLLPEVQKLPNGNYRCGTVVSANMSFARSIEALRIRQTAMQQLVYQDLNRRLSEGENLGQAERNFMAAHPAAMKKYGLAVDRNGKLQRQDGGQIARQIAKRGGRI